jgi:hypothetical protein
MLAACSVPTIAQQSAKPTEDHLVPYATFHRTTQVDGLSIFYREAGPKDAPTDE